MWIVIRKWQMILNRIEALGRQVYPSIVTKQNYIHTHTHTLSLSLSLYIYIYIYIFLSFVFFLFLSLFVSDSDSLFFSSSLSLSPSPLLISLSFFLSFSVYLSHYPFISVSFILFLIKYISLFLSHSFLLFSLE